MYIYTFTPTSEIHLSVPHHLNLSNVVNNLPYLLSIHSRRKVEKQNDNGCHKL